MTDAGRTEGFRPNPDGSRTPACGKCGVAMRHGEEADTVGFWLEEVRVCARCWAARNESGGCPPFEGPIIGFSGATHQPKPQSKPIHPSPPRGAATPPIATIHFTVNLYARGDDDNQLNPSSRGVEGEEGSAGEGAGALRDWLDRLVLNEDGSAELWD